MSILRIGTLSVVLLLTFWIGAQAQPFDAKGQNFAFGTSGTFASFTSSTWTPVPDLSVIMKTGHKNAVSLLMSLVVESDDFSASVWNVGFSRDGALMDNPACQAYYNIGESGTDLSINLNCVDTPSPGEHIYGVMIRVQSDSVDGVKVNQDFVSRQSISSITAIKLR